MNRSTKRFTFFKSYLFRSYTRVCFQLVTFVREYLVIYKAFCSDRAQGHINGTPNKTRTHSFSFAS